MCIAIPMTVESSVAYTAVVVRGEEKRKINTALIGENLAVGQIVLVFNDQGLRLLTPQEAHEITVALGTLDAVMAGQATQDDIDAGFEGIDGEPELPAHLRAMVGKKVL